MLFTLPCFSCISAYSSDMHCKVWDYLRLLKTTRSILKSPLNWNWHHLPFSYLADQTKFSRTKPVKDTHSSVPQHTDRAIAFGNSCSNRYTWLQWKFLNIIQETREDSLIQCCQLVKCWIFYQPSDAKCYQAILSFMTRCSLREHSAVCLNLVAQ